MKIKMKIEKSSLIIAGIIVILLTSFVIIRFVLGGGEDNWIKNSRGVYMKHGNPSFEPVDVMEQQQAINCSLQLINDFRETANSAPDSQCLGVCGNYAVDIVHVPRIEADNLIENQCADYANGKILSFIELDKNGEIVRIG